MTNPPTRFFAAEDGARLAYLDEGVDEGADPGAPVVLCLSGLTRTKEDFDEAMPALSGLRVLRMDYRGRGESAFTGSQTYSIAQEARDAIALLDHLGVAKAGVLGTSRGGIIGMYLARKAKARMSGLCLVDIGPEIDPSGLTVIRDYVGRRPSARTLADLAERLPRFSVGFEGVSSKQWQDMAARLYIEAPDGLHLRYDPSLRDIFSAEFDAPTDQWPDWEATAGMPVALIRGAGTNLLDMACVNRMRAIRPDLIFADVPGRGHVPFLDEPESVAVLQAWTQQLR